MIFGKIPIPAPIDASILQMASFTDLPTQPVNLLPKSTFLGTQVQQIKSTLQPPPINTAAPVNISRRVLANGQLQFRVQFVAPTDPTYQATSVSISSANGTQQFFASAPQGPIIFNTPRSAGSASLVLQNQRSNGSISDTGLGIGLSRTINQS